MPPSLTAWTRLEPRPRAPSIAPALAARIRDPLWLLTRQWQVGEFHGEDAGSPAWAQLSATTSSFTGWVPEGEQAIRPLTTGDPLEDLVESEPFMPDLALRVELGQLFEDLLARNGVPTSVADAIRASYPLPPLPGDPPDAPLLTLPLEQRPNLDAATVTQSLLDAFTEGKVPLSSGATVRALTAGVRWTIEDTVYGRRYVVAGGEREPLLSVRLEALEAFDGDREAARFRQVCDGRVIDGYPIYLAGRAKVPVLPLAGQTARAVETAAAALAAWVAEVYGEVGVSDPPAWQPERLEYRLAAVAGAPDGTTVMLGAHGGRTGAFDWYAFDLAGTSRGRNPTDSIRFSILPGHVRFRGCPNRRWWNFEAGTTPFGEIEPDRRDVAKLVVMDFMLVHGNDWFAIPLDQRVGTLCRIDTLVVTDVFGVETLVQRAEEAAAGGELWTLFSTSASEASDEVADFLLLPPTAAAAAQPGPVLEEVRYLRDEMANFVWGVEGTAENGVGEPWPGHERDQARRGARGPRPPATTTGLPAPPLRYLIQTPVPESWIPFPPVVVDPAKGIVRLERSYLQRAGEDIIPVGRILQPSRIQVGAAYQVFEEEVPREGIRVSRRSVRARWTDGSTHLWIARRKNVGTSEGASGLRFDVAVPAGLSPDEI